jgi:hypothetical protein
MVVVVGAVAPRAEDHVDPALPDIAVVIAGREEQRVRLMVARDHRPRASAGLTTTVTDLLHAAAVGLIGGEHQRILPGAKPLVQGVGRNPHHTPLSAASPRPQRHVRTRAVDMTTADNENSP